MHQFDLFFNLPILNPWHLGTVSTPDITRGCKSSILTYITILKLCILHSTILATARYRSVYYILSVN